MLVLLSSGGTRYRRVRRSDPPPRLSPVKTDPTERVPPGAPTARSTPPEKGIGWNAKQIKGRVKLQRLLPSELPVEDLTAVARKMVPAASAAQVEGLVGFAQGSDDYLAGIERLVCHATFFANREGREVSTNAHLQRALQEAMPTLQAPDPVPSAPRKKTPRKARALPLQEGCNRFSDTPPAPLMRRAFLDLPASDDVGFGASERLQFSEAAASE